MHLMFRLDVHLSLALLATFVLEGPSASKLLTLDVSGRTGETDSFGGSGDSVFGRETLQGVVADQEFLR